MLRKSILNDLVIRLVWSPMAKQASKQDNQSTKIIDVLRHELASLVAIPPNEWLFFAAHLRIKFIKKNEIYFQQGEFFDEIGFIAKGLMYNFFVTQDGHQAVKVILGEGRLVSPYSTIIKNEVSPFSAKAIESTVLITLKYESLKKMYQRHICWERLGRVFAEKLYDQKEVREMQFLTMNAKSRYEAFCSENEKILKRIPQRLAASYCGITPEALSRIKKYSK